MMGLGSECIFLVGGKINEGHEQLFRNMKQPSKIVTDISENNSERKKSSLLKL